MAVPIIDVNPGDYRGFTTHPDFEMGAMNGGVGVMVEV